MSSLIRRGMHVEWRSEGDRRPYVFFKGRVLDVPTTGTWKGTALVDDGSGLNPRAVKTSRLSIMPCSLPQRFAGHSA